MNRTLKGINLGGWLVLEKWITPSLFKGTAAEDEFSLLHSLEDGASVLDSHRKNFITELDIARIASSGFQAVRLPVPYWLFEADGKYLPCKTYVDSLLDWAEKYEIQVLLDLHTAPGSQNGLDHSGKKGEIGWHLDQKNIDKTLSVIAKISKEYGSRSSLWGIELLNEPSKEIPLSVLQNFYRLAYQAVRAFCPLTKTVVIHDAYRPLIEWQDFVSDSAYQNLLLDTHLYQVFAEKDKKMDFNGHIQKTLKWKQQLAYFGVNKIVVGEWSGSLSNVYKSVTELERWKMVGLFMQAQQYAFDGTAGHFYWTYKTEQLDTWNYSYLQDRGVEYG